MSDLVKIDAAIESGIMASEVAGKMSRAIAVATAVEQIRDLLTPEVIKPIMALQNKNLGFKTDKVYSEDIVKDCLIEAVLQGVYPVGNEFNILAGRCYITREGMTRKLSQISGLSYSITPGIPQGKDGGAIVEMIIDYSYNGNSQQVKIPICVRINAGMGADAILGKADRKAKAWLFRHITGKEVPEGEMDDVAPLKNVTPKKSPFESKAVEVKAEVPANLETMSKKECLETLDKICADNGITGDMLANWEDKSASKLSERPEVMLRTMIAQSEQWVKAVKAAQ